MEGFKAMMPGGHVYLVWKPARQDRYSFRAVSGDAPFYGLTSLHASFRRTVLPQSAHELRTILATEHAGEATATRTAVPRALARPDAACPPQSCDDRTGNRRRRSHPSPRVGRRWPAYHCGPP
jgi:hypothetical protein